MGNRVLKWSKWVWAQIVERRKGDVNFRFVSKICAIILMMAEGRLNPLRGGYLVRHTGFTGPKRVAIRFADIRNDSGECMFVSS